MKPRRCFFSLSKPKTGNFIVIEEVLTDSQAGNKNVYLPVNQIILTVE